jgi:hypothetical protein
MSFAPSFYPISTIVKDEFGEVLPYVNVYEKSNPTNGTISLESGFVQLNVSKWYNTVVFSFAGSQVEYKANEVPSVVVIPTNQLDEVVVTAPNNTDTPTSTATTTDQDRLKTAINFASFGFLAFIGYKAFFSKNNKGLGSPVKIKL